MNNKIITTEDAGNTRKFTVEFTPDQMTELSELAENDLCDIAAKLEIILTDELGYI